MSVSPSPATLAYWTHQRPAPVSDVEIASLEGRLGLKAPPGYVEFMRTYGAVEFDTVDTPCCFSYIYEGSGQIEQRASAVSFIMSPQRSLRYYEGTQSDAKLHLPRHLVPFGMDYGQGELLIEFGQPTERIYYWDFDTHDWESGVTRIGFVVNDLVEFINTLKPYED